MCRIEDIKGNMKDIDVFFFDMGSTVLDFHASKKSDIEMEETGLLKVKKYIEKMYYFIDIEKLNLEVFQPWLEYINTSRKEMLQEKRIDKLKGIYQDKKLIFADSIGNPIEHKRPNREVKKICQKINIPDRTFHSIRHSYATRLFELNVPVKTVQHLLGHSTINTTMNIYTHVMEEQKTDEVQKLNKLL